MFLDRLSFLCELTAQLPMERGCHFPLSFAHCLGLPCHSLSLSKDCPWNQDYPYAQMLVNLCHWSISACCTTKGEVRADSPVLRQAVPALARVKRVLPLPWLLVLNHRIKLNYVSVQGRSLM